MKISIFILGLVSTPLAFAYPLPMNKILQAYDCQNCAQFSHEPLEASWPLKDQAYQHPGPIEQRSASYRLHFTGTQLQQGVAFELAGPGAVIQLKSKINQAVPQVELKTPGRQLISLREAATYFSQGDQTLGAGEPTLLQLKPGLGAGKFELISHDKSILANQSFTLQVYDKFSANYLSVSTDKLHYFYGDKIKTTVRLTERVDNYPVESLRLSLIAPDGTNTSVPLTKLKHGEYEAVSPLLSPVNTMGSNWVAQAELLSWYGSSTISRLSHASFSYTLPSASLYEINREPGQELGFKLGLKVMTPSRYKLEAVLFQKDESGHFHPLTLAQSANWLDTGKQTMGLHFKIPKLAQQNLEQYYLGYIHLTDFGQMNTVYHYDKYIRLDRIE